MKKNECISWEWKVPRLQKVFRIMKLTVFLLLLSVISVFASKSYSQTTLLNLDMENSTVKEVLRNIEKQSEFVFMYSEKLIDVNREVSVPVKNKKINEVLDELFAGTDVSYKVKDRFVLLTTPEVTGSDLMAQQQKSVSGKVTDSGGSPLPGVTVIIKGTTQGTVTNADGNYSLTNIPEDATLVFSFVGMRSQEIFVAGKTNIDIVMTEETVGIDEVVVIGYGSVARKNLIGSVDQIDSRTIESRAVGDVSQALQGAASNLIIQQRSADPNSKQININIRGISTIGDNAPLIVIDGVISSDLNTLNPMDIDKVSVLKDAGSAAIYGSRSANGVILITTKQGKLNEELSIQFHGTYGIQSPQYTFEPVHGYENAILRNIADYNSGNTLSYTPEQIQYYKEKGDSEWFLKQILENAPQQNYNLSVRGGSDKTTYMMSFGYFDQKSNFVGPNYGITRYSVRNHTSTEIKQIKLSSNISYARTEEIDFSANRQNTIADAYRIPLYPDLAMKNDNGKYLLNDYLSEYNSLGMLEKGGREQSYQDYFMGILEAEINIMEGLSFKANLGTNIKNYHRFARRTQVDFYLDHSLEKPTNTAHAENSVEDYNEKNLGFYTQLLLDYNRTFNNIHRVYGLFGHSTESFTRESNAIQKVYTDTELGTPLSETILSVNSYNTPNGTEKNAIHSYFGRAGYSYLDKYYAEVSFRYDGSSKFARGKRWGLFPSISAGWRPSDESFMQFYKENVGDLKIRASYGVLGNQNIGNYQFANTYRMEQARYAFGNQAVSATSYSLANPNLTWEKAKNFDAGLDMLFFDHKLGVSLGYFNKFTSDILLNPIVSSTFGSGMPNFNMGEVRNRGWEATINLYATTGEFGHQTTLNIADSKNKVTKYGDTNINKMEEFYLITQEGLPYNSFYAYERDGYFQTEEELLKGPFLETSSGVGLGDIRYKDVDGDGFITPEKDRVVVGNAFPRYTFGFNYQLTWRDFDLGLFFQGVGKRTLAIRGELVDYYHFNWSYTMFKHQLDYWTPNNRDARYPRLAAPGSASNTNNYRQPSDMYLFGGKYLRMKNITLGYTIPADILSRMGIKSFRFYLTAENLLTFSETKFVDPEYSTMDSNMSGGAGSFRSYLTPKYFGGGIDLKF